MKHTTLFLNVLALLIGPFAIVFGEIPLVINTWPYTEATQKAWNDIIAGKGALNALENGMRVCQELQCDYAVGYGGSPDENGEITLDGMLFDGNKMDMGAIGGLRRIKDVIGVARRVLDHTKHSILVGDQATEFAKGMGFEEESLSTNESSTHWKNWKSAKCQPNFWRDVRPNPKKSCGPYRPIVKKCMNYQPQRYSQNGHDTIAMIVIDPENNVVAGTSTNGLPHKIPGRVGDSPIPGAGAYADSNVGAAGCTGDGDKMMRFLPSFVAVEEMRRGKSPNDAARIAIARIAKKYKNFFGAIIVANKNGDYGAACNGFENGFMYSVANKNSDTVVIEQEKCTNPVSVIGGWQESV